MKKLLRLTEHNSKYNSKTKWKNDGFRSLYESIGNTSIINCLKDLQKHDNSNNVLIGGLAVSYYLRPRETDDVDLLFLSENELPSYIIDFKKIRPHAFKHLNTHVEVEVLTGSFLKICDELVNKVFENYNEIDGIKIASPVELIALKLGRFSDKDKMDIKELMLYCIENKITIDYSDYNLSDKDLENYNSINLDNMYYENAFFLECDYLLNNRQYEIIENNDFDIYLFKENNYEPSFCIFSKDKKTRYCLDLYTYEIMESTTYYKSFLTRENLYEPVKKYLNENGEYLKNRWNKLNS